MKNILFLCVANSARSQMAHGWARQIFDGVARVESAGSHPTRVNPHAIEVMKECGVDISHHQSENVENVSPDSVDVVITLCEDEVCPAFLGEAERLHWPLPDPAGFGEGPEEELQAFRNVRDEIKNRLLAYRKTFQSN